jgi:hypothetical protein
MANNIIKTMPSFIATVSDRIKDLVIKDGQMIFITDEGRIALDYKGKRTFYNQINELESERERLDLSEPINGKYYFVIETAVFWRYYNGWQQITTAPDDIVFIGTEMPELGKPKTLYVDKENREISVWDDTEDEYVKVSNYTDSISVEEISALFNL